MMKFRLVLTLIVAATLVSACGFKLRGKVDLDPRLANVYVDGNDFELVRRLEDGLEFSGSNIVGSATAASAVVDLYKINYSRLVKTTDLRGKATGYTLKYDLQFRVKGAAGNTLLKSKPIKVSRNLIFNSAQVLEKSDEEEFLQEEMQREIVPRILRQIGTIGKS